MSDCILHFHRTVLRENIVKDLGIGCFMPANGETVTIQKRPMVELDISSVLVHRALRLSTPSPFAQPDLQRPFEHDMYARMVFPDKEAVQRGERVCCRVLYHREAMHVVQMYKLPLLLDPLRTCQQRTTMLAPLSSHASHCMDYRYECSTTHHTIVHAHR